MPTIVCHPDNWAALKQRVDRGDFGGGPEQFMPGFDVKLNSYMERDKPTGKYRLPSGRVVEQEDVRVRERFVDYGPEDIDWLLYSGTITEDREMVFVVMQDDLFRVRMDMGPIMPPRRVLFGGAV